MYKPWKFAEIAEKIDIIDLQNRGIAIPVAHLSGAGGPRERDTLQEILRSLRGANKDRAFIVLDKDESIDFLTSTGTPKSAQEPIDRNHMGIAKAGGSEYSEIGPGAGGGRASASVLATGFFINVDAIRILIQDMINFGVGPMPGLSEEIQDANFDTEADKFEYARIEGSRVSPTEQFDNIPLIQDSVKSGLIPPSLKYANETARRLGWPEITQEEFKAGMELMGKGQQPMGRPGEAGADPNPTRGDKMSQTAPESKGKAPEVKSVATEPSDPVARRSLQLAGTKGGEALTGRVPTAEEVHVLALAEIDNTLKSAESSYAAILHRGQRREIENIVEQVKGGLSVAELLKEDAEGKLFKYRNQIANDLKNKLSQVRNFGMGQVRDEVKRSKRKVAISAFNENHDDLGRFAEGPGGVGPTISKSRGVRTQDKAAIRLWTTGGDREQVSIDVLRDPRTLEGAGITEALNRLPKYAGVAYRGMDLSEVDMNKFTSQKEILLTGHASASKVEAVARDFAGMTAKEDAWKVLIEVHAKSAADIGDYGLPEFSDQHEVVLKAGTSYTAQIVHIDQVNRSVEVLWREK